VKTLQNWKSSCSRLLHEIENYFEQFPLKFNLMDEIKGMAFPPAILEKLRDGNEAQEP
jgi:hypothetical protein